MDQDWINREEYPFQSHFIELGKCWAFCSGGKKKRIMPHYRKIFGTASVKKA